jgi:NTP-dependent ternary system trypsin peptidase co-occuring protein
MAEIGLAEAIRALRVELDESRTHAKDKDLRFEVGTVDLEFQVAVTTTDEVGAGVKFWVLDASGKSSDATATTHTVRIQLKPSTADGGEVYTGDKVQEFPN